MSSPAWSYLLLLLLPHSLRLPSAPLSVYCSRSARAWSIVLSATRSISSRLACFVCRVRRLPDLRPQDCAASLLLGTSCLIDILLEFNFASCFSSRHQDASVHLARCRRPVADQEDETVHGRPKTETVNRAQQPPARGLGARAYSGQHSCQEHHCLLQWNKGLHGPIRMGFGS